jgi:hypothetical protein
VALSPTSSGKGFLVANESGAVEVHGDASFQGLALSPLSSRVTAAAMIPGDPNGYWLLTEDGSVLAFGDALFLGPRTVTTLTGGRAGVMVSSTRAATTHDVAWIDTPSGPVSSATITTTWSASYALAVTPAQRSFPGWHATSVTATVSDGSGRPVPDGTPVTFTVTDNQGALTTTKKTTTNGAATLDFVAHMSSDQYPARTTVSVTAAGHDADSFAQAWDEFMSPPDPPYPMTPWAPTAVEAVGGDGEARVSWIPPDPMVGVGITGYVVTSAYGDPVRAEAGPGATSVTVRGLHKNGAYWFIVTPVDADGPGPPTWTSHSVHIGPDPEVVPGGPGSSTAGQPAGAGRGYWMLGSDGRVYSFGAAPALGNAPGGAADVEPTPSGQGYWVLGRNGTVSPFGDAASLGSVDTAKLAKGEEPASLSATPSGRGYWVFTNRGRAVAFGDAPFLGDMSQTKLNGPVLGSVATPSGRGYYMVASDGGIFAFGDAAFAGSMGGQRLNAPVQSLVPDADGHGYWLVASDGGIFAFDAPFRGSMGSTRLNKPVVGMVRYGDGYLMVGADGGIFNFSTAPFSGSLGGNPPASPVVAVAALP